MNQYYICNSSNFSTALEWAGEQSKNGNIKLTTYVEARSDQIMKNEKGPHQWDDRPYDFARTAASVMRLGLLLATDLEQYYSPKFESRNENKRAFTIFSKQADGVKQINNDSLLAPKAKSTTAKKKIRFFFSYFDTMYAYHFICALLIGQTGQQRRSIRRQMIIINPLHHVIWQVTSTLYIVINGETVTKAIPFVAIWRYDPVCDRMIAPFVPLPDYEDDKEFDAVVEGIRNAHL